MLVHTSPSGIETFFTIAHEEFAKSGGTDMTRVMATAAERGLNFVGGNVL